MANSEEQVNLKKKMSLSVQEPENRVTILEEKLKNAQKRLEQAQKDYVECKKERKANHLISLIALAISIAISPYMFVVDLTTIMFSSIFGEMSVMTLLIIMETCTGIGGDLMLCIKTKERITEAKKTIDGTELQILFLKNELAKEYANINQKQQKESRKKIRKQLKKQLEILRTYGANWQSFVKKDTMENWKLTHKKKLENKGIDTELYESFVRRLELKRNLGEEI